jgi:predicted ribosome quality control (RQC) complex YloA/Tae2 family protein
MATKTINIQIPYDKNIDNSDFSPDENYVMLKVGSECLLEARKAIAVLTQREMFNKMKEESKEEVKKLEIDCLVQKELFKQLEVSLKNMYETFISKTKESYEHEKSQLNKTIVLLNEEVRQYEDDSGSLINSKIENEREKWKEKERELDSKIEEYEKKSEEYEKKGEKMRATYELMLANTNRSNSAKGSEGEKQFQTWRCTLLRILMVLKL